MTQVYVIMSSYNTGDYPEMESGYFDRDKAINHLHELCNQWNEWLKKYDKNKRHAPYQVDEEDGDISYPIESKPIGRYLEQVAVINVLEVE